MRKTGSFENFDRHENVKLASNRSFGIVFSVFFSILFGLSLHKGSDLVYLWGTLGGITLAVTVLKPALLLGLNKLWSKFGLLLHKITTPIIMGLMFFVVFVPLGFVLRLFKKLSLTKAFDSSLTTYWIDRTPKGPSPKAMKDPF